MKIGVDVAFQMNDKIFKNIPGGGMLDYFMPARSISLDTVAEAAVQAVNGEVNAEIIGNEDLYAYETTKKWSY